MHPNILKRGQLMDGYKQTEQIKTSYKDRLPKPRKTWPPGVRRAFVFIIMHLFEERLTVAWMQEQCRINSKSFAPRFCHYVNRYPKEFIMHHRMETAKRILKETGVSVTTAAVSVGFNSMASFSNSFKSRFGMTPSRWRGQN